MVRALAREAPTIMLCPHYGKLLLCQMAHESSVINRPVMQSMKMYDT